MTADPQSSASEASNGASAPAGAVQAAPGVAPVVRAGAGRHIALFGVVVFLIALDLWSKTAVFDWLETPGVGAEVGYSERGHVRYSILGDWLGFMLNLNYGAAFGKAAGAPWLLVGGRCLAALFLSWLIYRTPRGQKVYLLSLIHI